MIIGLDGGIKKNSPQLLSTKNTISLTRTFIKQKNLTPNTLRNLQILICYS